MFFEKAAGKRPVGNSGWLLSGRGLEPIDASGELGPVPQGWQGTPFIISRGRGALGFLRGLTLNGVLCMTLGGYQPPHMRGGTDVNHPAPHRGTVP